MQKPEKIEGDNLVNIFKTLKKIIQHVEPEWK